MHTIRAQVHRYIVDSFLFGCSDVDDEASLTAEGIIDSTGVLELIMYLEDNFGIVVSDDEVVPEHFDSVAGLATFIERRRPDALKAAS